MKARTILILLVISATINVALARKVQSANAKLEKITQPKALSGVRLDRLQVSTQRGEPSYVDFTKDAIPTLLYVFRPSCGWCNKNLDNVHELARASAANRNFQIVGISLDEEGLQDYVKTADLNFPIYTNIRKDDIQRLGLGATPQTLLISGGTIKQDWSGAYSGELLKQVDQTLM
jgi:hypothetical protein